jgi:Mor family transcriptional regulator
MDDVAADQSTGDDKPHEAGNFIRFVERRLGEDVAATIKQEFGGERFYLAGRPRDHQRMAKLIGLEAATLIAKEFGDGVVEVPLGPRSRSALIEQACIDGLTATEIVKRYHCCSRTVYKTRAKLRRQGRLP